LICARIRLRYPNLTPSLSSGTKEAERPTDEQIKKPIDGARRRDQERATTRGAGTRANEPAGARARFGVTRVEVSGFRSVHGVAFSPGPLCALVGEANAGKSNLLAAIRAVLDPTAASLTAADMTDGGEGEVSIRIRLADGAEAALVGSARKNAVSASANAPPTLFLPAEERAGALLPTGTPRREGAAKVFERAVAAQAPTPAARALGVLQAVESCKAEESGGLLLLIEEPELFLRPQAQRYLYRLLREFSLAGNQVIYSTHSPAFLNVTRMDELVFVERLPDTGTQVIQPEPVSADEDFRVMTEFDAARSELFLAHAVVLVEGLTEKLVLPFVFAALGHDVDRDGISVIECGGKPNLPLFARICKAAGIPFLVVHDSDRKSSGRLAPAEQALNALIAETAGEERVIVLDPDFEEVAGLEGHRHKPEHAWREFAERPAVGMPAQLVRVAELTMSFAHQHAP
jgi:predicted ATPase